LLFGYQLRDFDILDDPDSAPLREFSQSRDEFSVLYLPIVRIKKCGAYVFRY
jgi:hypothetical protein